jgi:hypothetical protein
LVGLQLGDDLDRVRHVYPPVKDWPSKQSSNDERRKKNKQQNLLNLKPQF